MPYRARGEWVMKQKGGRWVRHKKHTSNAKAKRHASALNINYRPRRKRTRRK